MLALCDGDIFCYRSAAAAENEDEGIAKYYLDKLIDDCLMNTMADEFKIFLTGNTNFRFQVYPEYKANRLNVPKPRHLAYLRNYVQETYAATVSDGCEADDDLGVAQCTSSVPTVIVSLDKDLLQIPGKHYSWRIEGGTPDKRWVKEALHQDITPLEGKRWFYTQMLSGDTSDNIKGVSGIGKVKAAKLMANEDLTEEDMFNTVRDLYSCDEEMLMNGQVLYIWQKPNDIWKLPIETS